MSKLGILVQAFTTMVVLCAFDAQLMHLKVFSTGYIYWSIPDAPGWALVLVGAVHLGLIMAMVVMWVFRPRY